jgi:hypothetical protein
MCISPADAETLGVTRFNRNPSPRQDDDIKENQTPMKRDAFKAWLPSYNPQWSDSTRQLVLGDAVALNADLGDLDAAYDQDGLYLMTFYIERVTPEESKPLRRMRRRGLSASVSADGGLGLRGASLAFGDEDIRGAPSLSAKSHHCSPRPASRASVWRCRRRHRRGRLRRQERSETLWRRAPLSVDLQFPRRADDGASRPSG